MNFTGRVLYDVKKKPSFHSRQGKVFILMGLIMKMVGDLWLS